MTTTKQIRQAKPKVKMTIPKLKRKHRGIYLISHDGINISISNPKVCNYGLGSNEWQLLIEYTDTAEPLYNWWFKKKADAVKEAIKWMDNYSNHI